MKILIVDDMPDRHVHIRRHHQGDEVTSCYAVDQACELALDNWDIVYLDFDAGVAKENGPFSTYFPVSCVVALNPGVREVRVHSMNPAGAARMVELLKSAGHDVDFWNPYKLTSGPLGTFMGREGSLFVNYSWTQDRVKENTCLLPPYSDEDEDLPRDDEDIYKR